MSIVEVIIVYGGGGMNVTDVSSSLSGAQDIVGVTMLKKAMVQDTTTMSALLQGMQEASTKIMENSVTPNLGRYIDIRV